MKTRRKSDIPSHVVFFFFFKPSTDMASGLNRQLTSRPYRWADMGQSGAAAMIGLVFGLALMLSEDVASAMQITSTGPPTVQKALGESVTLACTYTPGPLDTGELDIEWSVINPDTTQRDQMLISYSGGRKHVLGSHELVEGLDFAATDPSNGDASISISSLTPAHTGVYLCKVKKMPGFDSRKISLSVLEPPSKLKCWVEGDEGVGESVSLHCKASQGLAPLQYEWNREFGGSIPSSAIQHPQTGKLVISNHSAAFAGVYRCDASNAVGKDKCKLNLRAVKPPSRAGVIAGIVVGCLLLIIVLIILIWLFIYKYERHPRFEKEMSNEIREDVPAPESRPSSRVSRTRSGLAYSQVGENVKHPSSTSTGYSAANGGNRYGYVV
ncbi:V-set and immunoglobulin domain-containing protein 8a isoform X2 [Denticeps clupeoides]|uniref:Ig-like domain-containing protein n=2 Tax=Denticeps clupeoides TaxID=299321 RepID=A0AAY4B455_9TELE|nr:coxsackievirus and adenovirus receptor homolog isoform X2 [Denticeps clupeoides]